MKYIQEKLTTPELLAQLAEEAAELGHAALKLRRVYDGTNPTPKSYEMALGDLHEEIADVKLLLKILGLDNPHCEGLHSAIMQGKLARWTQRLKKNGQKAEKIHDPARVVELEAELAAALKYISATKECATCKHQPSDGSPECRAAMWDCADCEKTECKCWSCGPNANQWEWRGAHGTE